ncbi:DNA mismatch repair endonuclease MutL [Youxingia wuxianensis]|uniref:DNA mismatch repair protein MutL n=1 Tax=Youxingia wuxianensis TaxID=2763678 RepID=A0A926EL15_9FIRM|nr:DNA mismatch repair endonuclease MutL [Youxingia wuxianensis]MBC8584330.1 DNA mismatch repair endonuclease MutL [Youxingia wuxianensis]
MGKINVLEKQVAELIAAGEVVERPASIVKELVENSIDAGAKNITVEIKGGGVQYIRVTDNGSGIEREDVANAFLRHATSKVRVEEDLGNIRTMGFRGEALASIAAMCRVDLLTRTQADVTGTLYRIDGEETYLDDAGCPVGTTITVRDVFYNTPARMKFLKKDVSEGNSVAAAIEKAALAYPQVAFKFLRDGMVKLQTPGDGKLLSAVRCVLGKEFADNAIHVSYMEGINRVDGLICKPSIARSSRSMQNFFINCRYVRSKTCMAALEESYRNSIMVGRFPSCVLNVTIPPYAVDVNVHPAKIEVRFADERSIFNLIYYGCKTALGTQDIQPQIKADELKYNPFVAEQGKTAPEQQRLSAVEYRRAVSQLAAPTGKTSSPPLKAREGISTPSEEVAVQVKSPGISGGYADIPVYRPMMPVLEREIEKEAVTSPIELRCQREDIPPQKAYAQNMYENARLVGELFGTYIVLEHEDEMILVDKHAAHERILFNQLKKSGIEGDRQLLITPISVQLSAQEHAAVLSNDKLLHEAGLTVEDFGGNTVVVREVAPVLIGTDIKDIVVEFAGKLAGGNTQLFSKELEEMYHTIACRAAVKAHDKTPAPHLEELIRLLEEGEDLKHCPHGRPISIRMSRHEIEKKFGRLG